MVMYYAKHSTTSVNCVILSRIKSSWDWFSQ